MDLDDNIKKISMEQRPLIDSTLKNALISQIKVDRTQWWRILMLVIIETRAQHQSHVVFIMVDDMGWNDVSFHGSNQILTPNIDALAYQGVILQQYYSEAICTPARTAFLTGKYPMRLGMNGMPLANSEDRGIPLNEKLLPSFMKEMGYATHLVGKWHVGMSRPEYLPTARGYDTHYGMRGGFVDYYTYNKVEMVFCPMLLEGTPGRRLIRWFRLELEALIKLTELDLSLALHPHNPQRASVLEFGLYHVVVEFRHICPAVGRMNGMPLANSEDRGIPLNEKLLPSFMKEMGYATHLVGKWHVGMSRPEYLPTARGYDTHYGMRGGFVDYYTYNKVEMVNHDRLMSGLDLFDGDVPQDHEQRYIVDALTDRAVKIIHRHNSSQPLFLHIAHNAPHAGNAGGALQPPLYTSVKHRHIANSDRRLFAEIMTNLDRSVGKVVRALAEKHILDDTIIVFVSDNGAPTVGTIANWGVNLPLRGIKQTPWEGAVRVPAFIWHASFRPRVWNGLMHITDWLPTLTAAAGGKFNNRIDGVNQWDPIVQDAESRRKEVLLTLEDSATNVFAAYRAGDYKIVVGNVSGLSNGYYGSEYMTNKETPPDYFPALRSCEVARIFKDMGMYMDFDEVLAMRSATTLKQEDPEVDATPCLPTPSRGCLYNVRRDPSENHDLWDIANKISVLLSSRLLRLWGMRLKRGPANIQLQADPANFNYTWTPWINNEFTDNTVGRSL